jgi:hypothetical protein
MRPKNLAIHEIYSNFLGDLLNVPRIKIFFGYDMIIFAVHKKYIIVMLVMN